MAVLETLGLRPPVVVTAQELGISLKAYRHDPLGALDKIGQTGAALAHLPDQSVLAIRADLARQVLKNTSGAFEDHADFFDTPHGTFGPRQAQIDLGHDLRQFLAARALGADLCDGLLALDPAAVWPGAGCDLLWRTSRPLFLGPERSAAFGAIIDQVVADRIVFRDRPDGLFRRLRRRFLMFRRFVDERAHWTAQALNRAEALNRAQARNGMQGGMDRAAQSSEGVDIHAETLRTQPKDVFDLVMIHGAGVEDEVLLEIYLGVLYALVSSVGLCLAFSLYLVGQTKTFDYPLEHLVSEALRLYPIAWMAERRLSAPLMLSGVALRPGQAVMVSAYATHHSVLHYDHPDRFMPQRWEGLVGREAFIPFGAGPHGCVGIGLSYELVTMALGAAIARGPWSLQPKGGQMRPVVGVALRPSDFQMVPKPGGVWF